MARVDNLENFLTDVAGAIKTKKGTTDKISAANFDTEIASITSGLDTSDATATADDIISPKTAYVKGRKIVGNLIRTYKKASQDIKISNTDIPNIESGFCVSPDSEYIALLHASNIELINIHDFTGVTIPFTEIDIPIATYSCVTVSIADDNGYRYISVKEDNQPSGILYYIIYDIANQQIIKTGNITTGLSSGRYSVINIAPASSHPNWVYLSGVCNDQSSVVGIINLDTEETDFQIYGEWFTNIAIDPDDRFVIVQYTGAGYTINDKGKLTRDLNWFGNEWFMNTEIEQAWQPRTGDVYNYTYNEETKTLSLGGLLYNTTTEYGIPVNEWPRGEAAFISKNVFASRDRGTYYKNTKISDTMTLIEYNPIKNKNQCLNGIEYITINNTEHKYVLHSVFDDANEIDTIKTRASILYNTSTSTVIKSDILDGKIAYGSSGEIVGTMSNNGELNYTSSSEVQTIPAGYTSGGTIAAYPVTEEEYNTCLGLTNQIMRGSEDKEYTQLTYIQANGTQWLDTGYIPNDNTKIIIELSDIVNSFDPAIFGANTTWDECTYLLYCGAGGIRWTYNGPIIVTSDLTSKHTITMYRSTVTLDGSTVSTDTQINSSAVNSTLTLFSIPGGKHRSSYKLYSFKIYKNDILIKNYIPAKDVLNVVCLYDTINKQYIYNQGSNEFISGEEVK